MLPLLAALLVAPPANGGVNAGDDTRPALLSHATFLLPGAYYAGWVPTRGDDGGRGGGIEVSLAHHFDPQAWSIGAFVQGERLGRTRAALGVEAGYELVGLELSLARDFGNDASTAQWAAQIGPYVSFGFVNLVARWVLAIDRRHVTGTAGDGAMLTVGFKLPIPL
jgi:hypothetical protein